MAEYLHFILVIMMYNLTSHHFNGNIGKYYVV